MLTSCSLLKTLLIGAYLLILKLRDWRRLFSNVMIFVAGTGFSYLLLGVIIVKNPSWATLLVRGSTLLYILLGVVLSVIGAMVLGLLGPGAARSNLFSRKEPDHDLWAAFTLGAAVVLAESLSCHICNPTIKIISAIYGRQGWAFATLISGTVFWGQSTIIVVVGIILTMLKQLWAQSESLEYVQIAASIILILVGLNLLWLA